ncbi:MAG: ComEC/Rec2 family competence protein, partial [Duncaniella sp.]|nr:ComEC/Rec2 family competence protein [Duncaniella sp.]
CCGASGAMSLAAVLATGIVTAYYFNIFPVCFLLVNIPVALLLPPLLGAGLLLILFKSFGIDLPWLCSIADFLNGAIDSIASTVSALPGATLRGVSIEPWEIALYYLILLLAGVGLIYRRRVLTVSALAFGIIAVAAHYLLSPSFPASELYITSTSGETSLLVREGKHLRLHSTIGDRRIGELLARDSVIYSRYMLRRGVATFARLSETDTLMQARRSGNRVTACGRSFLFVSRSAVDSGSLGMALHYLVVCRGFRGDVVSLAAEVSPDSVLLSGDLNRRRHDRYMRELTDASIPVRSLREEPFVIISRE